MCDTYETIFRESLKDFRVSEAGYISGYCDSSIEVESLLDQLKTLGFAYCVRSSHVKQSFTDVTKRRTKFFFQQLQGNVHISFFGPPFSVESLCTRHCVLGPKYYTKREMPVPDHLLDHVIPKKKRLRVPDTKKSDCPAVLYIKCVRVYPGYAIQSATEIWEAKAKVLRRLRKDIELSHKPESYLRFYLVASPANQHTHSTESVEAKGGIHPLLTQEIQNLVQNGMTSVKDVKLALDRLVNDIFADSHTPGRMNTTFYPSNKTIYTHVYRALHMIKKPVVYRSILKNQTSSHKIDSDEEIEVKYHIVDTSDSYSEQLEAREHVPETSDSYSQQLKRKARVPETSDSYSQQLETRVRVPETSDSYSQQLKARVCVPETSGSYSQQLKARVRIPETLDSYSQQLEARELCEQVSNLTYNCRNSEALQEVCRLLRECVKKLHMTNAEVAVPSTSKQ